MLRLTLTLVLLAVIAGVPLSAYAIDPFVISLEKSNNPSQILFLLSNHVGNVQVTVTDQNGYVHLDQTYSSTATSGIWDKPDDLCYGQYTIRGIDSLNQESSFNITTGVGTPCKDITAMFDGSGDGTTLFLDYFGNSQTEKFESLAIYVGTTMIYDKNTIPSSVLTLIDTVYNPTLSEVGGNYNITDNSSFNIQPNTTYTASIIYTLENDSTAKKIFLEFKTPVVDADATVDDSKKNGCSGDCMPPTFGIQKNTNAQIVTNGFGYNGNFVDVFDYHTEFPLITAKTHHTNNVEVKIYENYGVNNIELVQFGLGMPEIGSPLNDAQTLVEVYLDQGLVDEIVNVDSNNLVDVVNAKTNVVNCNKELETQCLEVSLDYVYRDQPKYNVMAINTVDASGNSVTNYLNDGVLVVGESMNAPLLETVAASKGGAFYPQKTGIVNLKLVDYKTDTWQDEYGYLWSSDNYKSFMIIDNVPAPIMEADSIWNVMTRLNSNFDGMIQSEIEKAIVIYDASQFTNDLP